ncbi:MAG: hypothetical protein HY898_25465 [Deltaproteobacteria bacterium]|nr:hypothetical protein [Deltaproteobacteria bacterium]
MRRSLLLAAMLLVTSCRDGSRETPAPQPGAPNTPDAAAAAPSGSAARASDAGSQDSGSARGAAMSDAELGALIERLSERPGDFPSDNFVSNETSYLDVASELKKETLRGKAYVGVGPEQNLTYLAMIDPPMAYIVDIRRGNIIEHLVLRACMESGSNRAEFVSALTARPVPASLVGREASASAKELAEAFSKVAGDASLRDKGVERSLALMARLGLKLTSEDRKSVAKIHQEFFKKGLELAYTMEGSARRYPSVGSLLAQTTQDGEAASFLGTEQAWQRVRALMVANRVVPVVGDFLGEKALVSIGKDMRERGLTLGVFYTSNVEQYLFQDGKYGRFVSNVRALPVDPASVLVRVWFDQGRKHPRQREGHRTTSLVMSAQGFLDRAERKPWRSYWEVTTDQGG